LTVCVVYASSAIARDQKYQFPAAKRIKQEQSHRRTHAFKESLGMLATGSDRFDVFRGCPASEHRRELRAAEHHRRVYDNEERNE
jgi:hypothetical protein